MKLTATLKISFVALLASLVLLALAWAEIAHKEFETELKRTASSNVEYLILCEFHGNPKPQPCQTIHRTENSQFAAAIRHLSQAASASRPSKLSAASDKILKLGRGSLASKEYLGCYRATKYPGFDQIYISPIGTDRECTWPDKYHVGSVAIPGNAFGQGAF